MVGAGEEPRLQPAFAFLAQLRAAMPASVMEGAENACLVAQHDDFLRADPERPECQRLGEVGLAADEQPGSIPDGVEITLIGRHIPIGR